MTRLTFINQETLGRLIRLFKSLSSKLKSYRYMKREFFLFEIILLFLLSSCIKWFLVLRSLSSSYETYFKSLFPIGRQFFIFFSSLLSIFYHFKSIIFLFSFFPSILSLIEKIFKTDLIVLFLIMSAPSYKSRIFNPCWLHTWSFI